jgi:hypothetical protein
VSRLSPMCVSLGSSFSKSGDHTTDHSTELELGQSLLALAALNAATVPELLLSLFARSTGYAVYPVADVVVGVKCQVKHGPWTMDQMERM